VNRISHQDVGGKQKRRAEDEKYLRQIGRLSGRYLCLRSAAGER
jgi:hypothetical protein